jgi:hypothetical protein
MGPAISNQQILDTLRELADGVSVPLWLFGGVAVDFMVGRWTRPHSDIDLNAWSEDRPRLSGELSRLGYRCKDQGWLTHWWQDSTGRFIEVVFLERDGQGEAMLRIPQGAPVGIPGIHPLWPDYVRAERFGELEGLRFRVGSPAGEWLGRKKSVIAGRTPEPKVAHDLALLEGMIESEELQRLRAAILR